MLALLVLTFFIGVAWAAQAHAFSTQQERWLKVQLKDLTSQTEQLRSSNRRARRLVRKEIKDPALRATLTRVADELGLEATRFVIAGEPGDTNLTDFSGAFIYITPETVKKHPDRLRFSMAHEYAHLALGHGLATLKLLFLEAANECYACVRQKDPVDAALDFKQARPEFAAAISREQEKEADAYATRLLAAKGMVLNYPQVMSDLHDGTCDDVPQGTHPSCNERLKGVYSVLNKEFYGLLTIEDQVRMVFSGVLD